MLWALGKVFNQCICLQVFPLSRFFAGKPEHLIFLSDPGNFPKHGLKNTGIKLGLIRYFFFLLLKRWGTFCYTNIRRLYCLWKCNHAGVLYRCTRVQPYSGLLYHMHPVFCLHVPRALSQCSACSKCTVPMFCLYVPHVPFIVLPVPHAPSLVLSVPQASSKCSACTECIIPLFCLYYMHCPIVLVVCTTCTIPVLCLYHMHHPNVLLVPHAPSHGVYMIDLLTGLKTGFYGAWHKGVPLRI